MIRYTLKCAEGHGFESWFRSAEAFDALAAAGQLECPTCGNRKIEKALMAPRVTASDKAADQAKGRAAEKAADAPVPVPVPAPAAPPPVAAPEQMPAEMRQAIEQLRTEVEKNSDYVGRDFATEARAMHEGEAPERAIHGEANLEEARGLLEDGILVLPLPFRDRRGTN